MFNVGENICFGGIGINGGDVGYIIGIYDVVNIYLISYLIIGNLYVDGGGVMFNFNVVNYIIIN